MKYLIRLKLFSFRIFTCKLYKTIPMELIQQFQCPICALGFDSAQKKPMMICIAQHTICKDCLQAIFKKGESYSKCPFCRTKIYKEQVLEFRLLQQIRVTASMLRKQGSMIRRQLMGAKKNEKQLQEELNAQKEKNQWLLSQLELKTILLNKKNQQLINSRAQNEKLLRLVGQQKMTIEKQTVKPKEDGERVPREKRQSNFARLYSLDEPLRKDQSYFNDSNNQEEENGSYKLTKSEIFTPVELQGEILIKKGLKLRQIDLAVKLNLVELDLSDNQLSNINLSKNSSLKKINLSWNLFNAIDLTMSTNLKQLNLSYNQLQNIDLSRNTELTHLDLSKNQINYLNLRENKNLQVVAACLNQLSTIDLSYNSNLLELNLAQNKLQKLDLRGNLQLKKLNVSLNRLSSIISDKNMQLVDLNLQTNNLASIDLTQNFKLTTLNLDSNCLSSIDLMSNPNLVDLNLKGNKFAAVINLMNNHKLAKVDLSNNQLKAVDLSNNRNTIRINLSENKLFSVKFFFRPQILANINDIYHPSLQLSNQNSAKTLVQISMKGDNQKQCVELIHRGMQRYRKNEKCNKYNSQYVFSMFQRK